MGHLTLHCSVTLAPQHATKAATSKAPSLNQSRSTSVHHRYSTARIRPDEPATRRTRHGATPHEVQKVKPAKKGKNGSRKAPPSKQDKVCTKASITTHHFASTFLLHYPVRMNSIPEFGRSFSDMHFSAKRWGWGSCEQLTSVECTGTDGIAPVRERGVFEHLSELRLCT